jgi:methylphosphotriester-DNA--protein-cysteine methyltransferase
MIAHNALESSGLPHLFKNKTFLFAGNRKLKIYGTLHCSSGKRMKKENRVFFKNEEDAINFGFRPCGHCLRNKYAHWKGKDAFEQETG